MLDFVKRAFRGGINVLLWINLILCTIGGGVAGYYLGKLISYRSGGGYTFGGILIGIILGLLSNIVGGGFIATIISIDENLETLKYNSSKTGTPSSGSSSGVNLANIAPINHINLGDSWVCKKCSERNPNASSSCKGCGSYK
jgi:ribosomal protein L40E